MRFATLCVLDETGAPVWDGSAMEFIRANEMTRAQVADMVTVLRGSEGMPAEPYTVGGGAAQLFQVCVVEAVDAPRVTRVEREFCPHCDATNFPEYIRCIACGRSPSEAAA